MLPAELLFEVCNHLDALDVYALSLACRENSLMLEPLLNLFKDCPWYQLRFSSWDSWQACAAKYKEPPKNVVFKRGKLPEVQDQPLPDDFTVLHHSSDHEQSQGSTTTDRGIYGYKHGVSIDLRAEPSTESLKPIYDVVIPDPLPEGSEADPFGEASALLSADTVWYAEDKRSLVVKDCHGKVRSFPRRTDCEYLTRVFDAVVFLGGYDDRDTRRGHEISYYLSGARTLKPVKALSKEDTRVDQWLLYNGALFKVVVGKRNRFGVVSLGTNIEEGFSDCCFRVGQNDRNPRYGLAYRLPNEGLQYVIDLEKQLFYRIPPYDHHLHFVGTSNGQLGVWSYTQDYLVEQKKKIWALHRGSTA